VIIWPFLKPKPSSLSFTRIASFNLPAARRVPVTPVAGVAVPLWETRAALANTSRMAMVKMIHCFENCENLFISDPFLGQIPAIIEENFGFLFLAAPVKAVSKKLFVFPLITSFQIFLPSSPRLAKDRSENVQKRELVWKKYDFFRYNVFIRPFRYHSFSPE
jgi:hypothetical protein